MPKMEWLTDKPQNDEFQERSAPLWNGKKTAVSIFCWRTFFLSKDSFLRLCEPLTQLGVTRVYQQLSPSALTWPETADMVGRLSGKGIETVYLTGGAEWLWDGLDEFRNTVTAIKTYNDGIGSSYPIRTIAIDAESYNDKRWNANPTGYFAAYTDLMAEARQLANSCGIRVIQVIPTRLDEINEGLFRSFVSRCCDEVSLMNYNKSVNLSAIWNEVAVCRELDIPVETLFETMPVSDERGVTENITYYYEGVDGLYDAVADLRSFYGTSLGVGFHHYDTLRNMLTGTVLVKFYPYSNSGDPNQNGQKQPKQPGVLWLTGSDGSEFPAYLYPADGPDRKYCYLALDVKPGVTYTFSIRGAAYSCADSYCFTAADAVRDSADLRLVFTP